MDDKYDVKTAGNGTGVYEAGYGSGGHASKEAAAGSDEQVLGVDSGTGMKVSETGSGEQVSAGEQGTGEQGSESQDGTGEQGFGVDSGTGEQVYGNVNSADLSIDLGGDMLFDPAADSVGGMDVIL
jgi:hypothetical protein